MSLVGRMISAGLILVAGVGRGPAALALESTPGYAVVQRAFLREDFQQVTELAQAFILQYPDVPEIPRVWLWLALSLDKLQHSNEALRELDRLKAHLDPHDPLWPELHFWEGDISRRALQMLRAKFAYRRVLDRHPDSSWASQAQVGLGLIYVHQQAYEQALGYFQDLAERETGTTVGRDAALFQGLCHLKLKQFPEAVAVLERLLPQLQDPNLIAQAAFYLGESLSELGRYDEAIAAYQRSITTSGTLQWSQPAWFGLGWAFYRLGRCEEGIAAFDEYLKRAAEHRVEALFAQGSCLMRLGREPEAMARFDTIASRHADHPLALESAFSLVDAARRQERFAEAKDLLHGFLRRRPDALAQTQIRLRLAAIALEQGNAAQARTIFSLVAEREEPGLRQIALNGLGDVQLFLGNLGEAKRFYEDAIRVEEASALADYARYQVGRIQLQAGATDEAIAVFQRLQAGADPGLAEDARLALVIAYLNQQEEAAARSLLEDIRQGYPGSVMAARAAYYEALVALGRGDQAAARTWCAEAMAGAKHSNEAFEARLLLADLEARAQPAPDLLATLKQLYDAEPLSRSHRATLAKRIGDLARAKADYPDAMQWYEQAMELLPSLRGEAAYWIASCYEEAGNFEEALRWYQQAEQLPWQVRGQLAAAKLLERQDRLVEAQAVYERLADEPIPEAKLVQERLAALRMQTR